MLTVHFYELCFVSFRNSHSESCMVKLLKNLGCLCWFIKEILTRKGVFTVSLNISNYTENWALPRWLSSKESACKYVDQETLIRKIPRSGRPPGEGNGNPLQYPGKFHRQRSLGSCSPWGRRRVGRLRPAMVLVILISFLWALVHFPWDNTACFDDLSP